MLRELIQIKLYSLWNLWLRETNFDILWNVLFIGDLLDHLFCFIPLIASEASMNFKISKLVYPLDSV